MKKFLNPVNICVSFYKGMVRCAILLRFSLHLFINQHTWALWTWWMIETCSITWQTFFKAHKWSIYLWEGIWFLIHLCYKNKMLCLGNCSWCLWALYSPFCCSCYHSHFTFPSCSVKAFIMSWPNLILILHQGWFGYCRIPFAEVGLDVLTIIILSGKINIFLDGFCVTLYVS